MLDNLLSLEIIALLACYSDGVKPEEGSEMFLDYCSREKGLQNWNMYMKLVSLSPFWVNAKLNNVSLIALTDLTYHHR